METPTQEEKEVLMAGVLFLWRRDGVRPEQVLEKPSDQGIARTTDETLGCHVLPGRDFAAPNLFLLDILPDSSCVDPSVWECPFVFL